jgi:hypothetical protein
MMKLQPETQQNVSRKNIMQLFFLCVLKNKLFLSLSLKIILKWANYVNLQKEKYSLYMQQKYHHLMHVIFRKRNVVNNLLCFPLITQQLAAGPA